MKLANVKAQIDAYFDNIDPTEVVRRFESLGYVIEDIIPETTVSDINYMPSDKFLTLKFSTEVGYKSSLVSSYPTAA